MWVSDLHFMVQRFCLISSRLRVQARDLKYRAVFHRFSDFREKFQAGFHFCLYVLYIKTSPLAENRDKLEPVGRLFLQSRPLACSLRLFDG